MINLEQIKLLETKVANAVEFVERVTAENAVLLQKDTEWQAKLDSCLKKEAVMQAGLEANQKRIDELEILIMRFKEEQGQIEDGILAALDRLSQFEEAMEKSLKGKPAGGKTVKDSGKKQTDEPKPSGGDDICFEISEHADNDASIGGDVIDPLDSFRDADSFGDADALEAMLEEELLAETGNPPEEDGELEIY